MPGTGSTRYLFPGIKYIRNLLKGNWDYEKLPKLKPPRSSNTDPFFEHLFFRGCLYNCSAFLFIGIDVSFSRTSLFGKYIELKNGSDIGI